MLTSSRKVPRRAGTSSGPGGKGELRRGVWLVFGHLRLGYREHGEVLVPLSDLGNQHPLG